MLLARLAKTEAFAQTRRDRKKVEMLFAHLKRILRLGRLRLRGPRGAQFEFTLAAIAQNMRRLAKLTVIHRTERQRALRKVSYVGGAGTHVGRRQGMTRQRSEKASSGAEPSPIRLLQRNRPKADSNRLPKWHCEATLR